MGIDHPGLALILARVLIEQRPQHEILRIAGALEIAEASAAYTQKANHVEQLASLAGGLYRAAARDGRAEKNQGLEDLLAQLSIGFARLDVADSRNWEGQVPRALIVNARKAIDEAIQFAGRTPWLDSEPEWIKQLNALWLKLDSLMTAGVNAERDASVFHDEDAWGRRSGDPDFGPSVFQLREVLIGSIHNDAYVNKFIVAEVVLESFPSAISTMWGLQNQTQALAGGASGDSVGGTRWSKYVQKGDQDSYSEFVWQLPSGARYASGMETDLAPKQVIEPAQRANRHWARLSDGNTVMHARATGRTDDTGRKVFLVEEVQSDWHQDARDSKESATSARHEASAIVQRDLGRLNQVIDNLVGDNGRFARPKNDRGDIWDDSRPELIKSPHGGTGAVRIDMRFGEDGEMGGMFMSWLASQPDVLRDILISYADWMPHHSKSDDVSREYRQVRSDAYTRLTDRFGVMEDDAIHTTVGRAFVRWLDEPGKLGLLIPDAEWAKLGHEVTQNNLGVSLATFSRVIGRFFRTVNASDAISGPAAEYRDPVSRAPYRESAGWRTRVVREMVSHAIVNGYDIVATTTSSGIRSAVGGEEAGQREWYDTLVRSTLERVTGVKPEVWTQSSANTLDYPAGTSVAAEGYAVPLTPEVKARVLQGFPLFALGGSESIMESPAFREWFGASQVVGSDGNPIVVYHGTSKDKDFSTFKTGVRGAWFTADPESASSYAITNDSQGHKWGPNGKGWADPVPTNTRSRVFPVYLRIENPYRPSEQDMQELRAAKSYRKAQELMAFRATRAGHDGIVFDEENPGKAVWVVFNSKQIKSATGNSGAFSRETPDIRYALELTDDVAIETLAGLPDHALAKMGSELDAAGRARLGQLSLRAMGRGFSKDEKTRQLGRVLWDMSHGFAPRIDQEDGLVSSAQAPRFHFLPATQEEIESGSILARLDPVTGGPVVRLDASKMMLKVLRDTKPGERGQGYVIPTARNLAVQIAGFGADEMSVRLADLVAYEELFSRRPDMQDVIVRFVT
jgi:hypothetical protein